MNQVVPYKFENTEIRVVEIDGEPWFVGKEVAETLGYSNASDAIATHCKGVAKRYPLQTEGGVQNVRLLSEADMLRLVVNSTLPAAERFESWVFEEVLPSIRKTGSYSVPSAAPAKSVRGRSPLTEMRLINFAGDALKDVPGIRADVLAAVKLKAFKKCTGIDFDEFRLALPPTPLGRMVRLNPTQIGARVAEVTGRAKVSAQLVNKILLERGLQRKVESGYVLTEAGMEHGEVHPFTAQNEHSGCQIDWWESVVDVVRDSMPVDVNQQRASGSVSQLPIANQGGAV